MRTDELIERLAADAPPVRRGSVPRLLLLTLAVATVLSLALMAAWLGMRPDMHSAMRSSPFWMKSGYTLVLGLGGLLLTLRLARPDGSPGRMWIIPGAAVTVLVMLAILQLATAPAEQWRALLMGDSWNICPWRILAFATPIYILTIIALRRLAPTRLAVAGAAAGLLAGGVGASVYGLHCQETAAVFTASWYTLGVALCAGLGALMGPRLLAWRR